VFSCCAAAQNNDIRTPFLNALSTLTQLELLDLTTVDTMPSSFLPGLERLPNLQTLSIDCDSEPTGLNRTLPTAWITPGALTSPNWPALRWLTITNCRVTGNLNWLNAAGVMPRLSWLNLWRNSLEGVLPTGESAFLACVRTGIQRCTG
jgi:hypothetical protein